MYTLNCSPRAQPFPRSATPSSSNSSPTTSQFPSPVEAQQAAIQFTNSLLAQINQLPAQPASLPRNFVTNFVKRCFTPQLELVDMVDKLSIDKLTLQPTEDTKQWCERDARIAEWVPSIFAKDKKIDALYTQCYIGLRRWVSLLQILYVKHLD
jgi:hypothetical protein